MSDSPDFVKDLFRLNKAEEAAEAAAVQEGFKKRSNSVDSGESKFIKFQNRRRSTPAAILSSKLAKSKSMSESNS